MKTKKLKVFAMILLTSALLLLAINVSVPSVKAASTTSVLVYTTLGGSIQGNGTALTPGATTSYTTGDVVNFKAVASSGYNFLGFEYATASGPTTSTTNPLPLTLTASSYAIEAMFTPTKNATQTSTATGTVSVYMFSSIGGTTSPVGGSTGPAYPNYSIGTTYSFTQTPGTDFKFLYWMIDTSAGVTVYTQSPLSLKIATTTTEGVTVQAYWIPSSSTLTVPTIISEFSSVMVAVLLSLLVLIATGTYVYTRRAKK